MMGSKERHFAPLSHLSLEALVPQDDFYRHLERTLDLSFVRELVQQTSLMNNAKSLSNEVETLARFSEVYTS